MFGGYAGKWLSDVHLYDPVGKVWSKQEIAAPSDKKHKIPPRSGHTCSLLASGAMVKLVT